MDDQGGFDDDDLVGPAGPAEVAPTDTAVVDRNAPSATPLWLTFLSWGIGFIVVPGILLGLLFAVGAIELDDDGSFVDLSPALLVVSSFAQWIPWVAIPAVAAWRTARVGPWPPGYFSVRLIDVPIGIAAGFGSQIFAGVALYPLLELAGVDISSVSEPAEEIIDIGDGAVGLLLVGLVVVIGAPLAEEILFRSLLQPNLVHSFGPVVGIVGASVLFAGSHFQLLQFPALLAIGLALGYVSWRAGRIGPALTGHVAFNAAAFTTLVAA